MNILLTGGAGFIGSHLVDRLSDTENDIIVLDNFSKYYSGKEDNIRGWRRKNNIKLVYGSILDKNKLNELTENIGIVVHLAAQPGVRYSIKHPLEVARININGTINVLEACVKNDVKKFVFGSSSSVYGDVKKLPAREDYICNPISPYGASKLAGEKYCYYYSKIYGIKIPMLRFFTVYGPRQRPDMAINKFVDSVMKEKTTMVYGDGSQTRDFTYIDDIVDGIILAIKKNIKTDAFNLGGGNNISVNELISLIAEYTEKKVEIRYIEKQKGDVKDTLADNTKSRKVLKWKPKTDIRCGLKKYVEWIKNR